MLFFYRFLDILSLKYYFEGSQLDLMPNVHTDDAYSSSSTEEELNDDYNTTEKVMEINDKVGYNPAGIGSYTKQWSQYFDGSGDTNSNIDLKENLKDKAFKGLLRSCHFRSVCWRVSV